ncbi:MAG: hypothetical protein LBD75_02755 [Candidatus Peribacteria bacterium]|nr:hypothetical protein [Candidatus Peribacteria bacterium]
MKFSQKSTDKKRGKIIIQNAPPISRIEMLKFLSHIRIDDATEYYEKGTTLQLGKRNHCTFMEEWEMTVLS